MEFELARGEECMMNRFYGNSERYILAITTEAHTGSPFMKTEKNMDTHFSDIEERIASPYLARGLDYYKEGRVSHLEIDGDEGTMFIASKVAGSLETPYDVIITIMLDKNRKVAVLGECTCPVGFNCKHVAATMYAAFYGQQSEIESREKEIAEFRQMAQSQPESPEFEQTVNRADASFKTHGNPPLNDQAIWLTIFSFSR